MDTNLEFKVINVLLLCDKAVCGLIQNTCNKIIVLYPCTISPVVQQSLEVHEESILVFINEANT